MTAYLLDWLAMLVRLLHVVAGIAWIGASFYFVWLDNSLEPILAGDGAEAGVAGELWAVHGGGFYRARKYRVSPPLLPPTLHWFYWEAYTTWLSGFALLCLLYLYRAEAYLIDSRVLALSKTEASLIVLGTLIGSWLIYDGLCRSPLGRRPRALALVLSALVAGLAYGLCHWFGGRGAYMVFGAALGTIMVANVLLVIIPGQRELVRAKKEGREPDAAPGSRGKQRSVHNTYFTVPVIFVMISHHYPMTYGARHNWLVLIAISFAGACLRAWFVLRHKRAERGALARALPGIAGLATLAVTIAALASSAATRDATAGAMASAIRIEQVQRIVDLRCAPCHSPSPSIPGFSTAPNGLMLQNPAELLAHAEQVRQQLSMQAMPLGNLTGMTAEERALMLTWLTGGVRP